MAATRRRDDGRRRRPVGRPSEWMAADESAQSRRPRKMGGATSLAACEVGASRGRTSDGQSVETKWRPTNRDARYFFTRARFHTARRRVTTLCVRAGRVGTGRDATEASRPNEKKGWLNKNKMAERASS